MHILCSEHYSIKKYHDLLCHLTRIGLFFVVYITPQTAAIRLQIADYHL